MKVLENKLTMYGEKAISAMESGDYELASQLFAKFKVVYEAICGMYRAFNK